MMKYCAYNFSVLQLYICVAKNFRYVAHFVGIVFISVYFEIIRHYGKYISNY